MPFSYYERLSAREKAIYRKSDEMHAIRLPPPVAHALAETVGAMQEALARDRREAVAAAAQLIAGGICSALGARPVAVEVLEVRPRRRDSELHGLYTWEDDQEPRIQVWMRTAAKARVVAWKTFLRTLIHELWSVGNTSTLRQRSPLWWPHFSTSATPRTGTASSGSSRSIARRGRRAPGARTPAGTTRTRYA